MGKFTKTLLPISVKGYQTAHFFCKKTTVGSQCLNFFYFCIKFEKNLYPIINSYIIIKLFNEKIFNPKNAQLIFATHDLTQLNDSLFNRDQVWFTQKDEFGATELIRCSDIKGLRLHAPLDKWYVSGRLGGTAIINDTDFIIAMQEGGTL